MADLVNGRVPADPAVHQGKPAPYPLEDSVKNMRVIDALFESGRSRGWEVP